MRRILKQTWIVHGNFRRMGIEMRFCNSFMAAMITIALAVGSGPTSAQESQPNDEEVNPDLLMLQEVVTRLVASIPPDQPNKVPSDCKWPPVVRIMDTPAVGKFNAFANIEPTENGEQTFVTFTPGFMEQSIAGSADRAAVVAGHELGHHLHGHTAVAPSGRTELLRLAYKRAQEDQADQTSVVLLLRAGYSAKGIRDFWEQSWRNDSYSSFEGLATDHPAPLDRLAFMDREQPQLWRAMSAFETGVGFLVLEQYASAEQCFEKVVEEFPASHEAWANLGYARLMRYCDGLETEDLIKLEIGQIVSGGFYRRPEVLQSPQRGFDRDLWSSASIALKRSVETARKKQLPSPLAEASLGLAYLVNPDGADPVLASALYQSALAAAMTVEGLLSEDLIAIKINAAVAEIAGGDLAAALSLLQEAERILDSAKAGPKNSYRLAVRLNTALLTEKSGDFDKAVELFETLVKEQPVSGSWSDVTARHYLSLCERTGREALKLPKPAEDLVAPESLRPALSVQIENGNVLTVSEPVEDLFGRIGEGVAIPLVGEDSKLRLRRYPARGIDVITAERVLAIRLVSQTAPTLTLRSRGVGSRPVELSIGMSVDDLNRVLDGLDYDFRQVDSGNTKYRYYASLGVAVRVQKGAVAEMVIGILPRVPSLSLGI